MSVNIFGGSGGSKISQNKFYIDEKFKTLSTNLASKVNKSGDTIVGDLLLNSADLRTFGVNDISIGQSFSLLLGDVDNQLRHNFGHPMKMTASRGWKVYCLGGVVCQLGSQTEANLLMKNNYITGLHDPERPQDAATKYYVDNRKSFIGYIPVLESNISRLGFCASASTTSNNRHQPFGAFNNLNFDGANGSWLTAQNNTTGWLQIKCPERVTIWRIALKARSGRDISSWNITASNDSVAFETLITSTTALLGSATAPTFFEVRANNSYKYYRFNITAGGPTGGTGTGSIDVGVQVFQLYIIG
jgi:hypothetical protein